MRGTLACRDNVRPAINMRTPLESPSFSLERINLPPFTYAMEAKKFEQRLPAARRYILEHGLNEHRPGIAMYNRQDSVLVILDNFYTSATGQHHNPSTGTNARKEPTGMTIPQALRGVGVSWIRTVDSYDIAKMIGSLRDALTTRAKGLKVVIARGECQFERQRRLRPLQLTRVAAGQTVVEPTLWRRPRRLHGRSLVHAAQRVPVADPARESRPASR